MKKNSHQAIPELFTLLPHMQLHIRISPFIPREWEEIFRIKNLKYLKTISRPDFWLDDAKEMQVYDSGRKALLACLRHLQLRRDDEVLIVKNTNGKYISGCITKTIEQVCRWSQVYSPRTRLVMVIHEFGFACPPKRFLHFKKMGIPILEDCAYSFGSRLEGAPVGNEGDYALYSLTKYYPVPLGGFLVSKNKLNQAAKDLSVTPKTKKLILQIMAKAHSQTHIWNKIRRDNWQFFAKRLSGRDLQPYFKLGKKDVPGVYITQIPANFPGEKVKGQLNTAGVEATQYYHQSGFYFPVHQFLTAYEKAYIGYYFNFVS